MSFKRNQNSYNVLYRKVVTDDNEVRFIPVYMDDDPQKDKGTRWVAVMAVICAILIGACIIGYAVYLNDDTQTAAQDSPVASVSTSPSSSPSYSISSGPSWYTPSPSPSASSKINGPFTFPVTGHVFFSNGEDRVAPLTINTRGENGYYIKLVDASSKDKVLCFFVRGGASCEIDVPLGTYILRYATGSDWYGSVNLFGDGTTYYEADDLFEFSVNGNYYTGWTVDLYLQTNGNLDTDLISASEF